MTLTFGSLFAGIGGIDLGLERAGMICKWQVEIDDYATKVLEKHWPDVARFRDVRECGRRNLEAVDLICGGFPCQPFSYTGNEKGIEDSRWGLWSEFARVVSEIQPRYVIVENVPGLLHHGMGQVLSDFATLGYDAEWDCIPAKAFGTWHNRDRLFIIAHTKHVGQRGCGACEPKRECQEVGWSKQYRCDGGNRIMAQGVGVVPTWKVEPGVGRVAHGVPKRVDRLRGLGNAVVPQVAEWIGRRIMEAAC